MKKRIIILLGVLLALLGAVLLINIFGNKSIDMSQFRSSGDSNTSDYESPIDFEKLWEYNEDVIAFLDIPGTEIFYPVVQDPEDDTYYTDHSWVNKLDKRGALFTEATYSAVDFTDPVTVIYGHHMKSGAMFGKLQASFSDALSFEKNETFKIYLPDRELTYEVIAAVPFDSRHILYSTDFTNRYLAESFFDDVFGAREIGAQFRRESFNMDDLMAWSYWLGKKEAVELFAGLQTSNGASAGQSSSAAAGKSAAASSGQTSGAAADQSSSAAAGLSAGTTGTTAQASQSGTSADQSASASSGQANGAAASKSSSASANQSAGQSTNTTADSTNQTQNRTFPLTRFANSVPRPVVILSTCLKGDNSKRYLVIGQLKGVEQ